MANNYYGQVGLVSSADDYSPKEISLDLGKTFQIPKTGMYKSSDESVATVNTAGLITVVGYGIANIAVNDVTEYTIENKLPIDTNCIYLGVIPTIDSFNNLTLTDVVELIKEGYLTPTVPTKTTINVGGDTLLCLIPNLEYECSKIDDSGEEKLFTGSVKANGEIALGPFHVYGAVSEGSEYINIYKKLKEIKTSSSGEGVDDPELDYATKEDVAKVEEEVEELETNIEALDIKNEALQYVNIISKQTLTSSIGGAGMQYIANQDGVLFQASKEAGVGKEEGDYYFVNFQLESGMYWQKKHHYYCAVEVSAKLNSESSVYLDTSPKFDNGHLVGKEEVKAKPSTGEKGFLKSLIDVNKEAMIDSYPDAKRLFIQFWNKIYKNDFLEVKIYSITLVDLGIPGTAEYKRWEDIDQIVTSGLKEYSVSTARIAHKLKVGNIECWGDSLTAQNYGKYIQGANVYTYGFGGKTSTYIRDAFLSNANKEATQVIWVGRNNYTETDVVIDDIRDMVSAIEHNDFIIMCPPNGYYGEFGTNGEDGTGEMKGGNTYSKFLELEKRLSEEYPSNFLNIRKAVIEGWRMGNVKLLSDFTQPSIGENVTIEVSDANFLTTYNSYDETKFGHDFVAKIRIGINGSYDVYKVIEKVYDTHLTIQLEEVKRVAAGSTVGNIIDSGGTNAIKYLRVVQNADYMCWLYDTTLSTFRKDGIHMTEDGLKLVAQIVSRKLSSMKLL